MKGNKSKDNVKDYPKMKASLKTNDLKIIKTRSGHTIELNDKKGNETITITDKKKNRIVIDTRLSNILISSEGNIDIVAKQDISLKAQNISLLAANNISETAYGNIQDFVGREYTMQAGRIKEISETKFLISAGEKLEHMAKEVEVSSSDGEIKLDGAGKVKIQSAVRVDIKG